MLSALQNNKVKYVHSIEAGHVSNYCVQSFSKRKKETGKGYWYEDKLQTLHAGAT